MEYQEKYPRLYQFLGGYFPDADLFDQSDEEVTINFKAEASYESIFGVIKEIEELMTDPDAWEIAAEDANRYFEKPSEILPWLTMIRGILLHQ